MNKTYIAEFDAKNNAYLSRLREMESRTNTAVGRIENSARRINESYLKFAGVTAALAGVGAFLKSSIEAYSEQERAAKRLDVALGKTSDSLQRYASELQRSTTFGDETIIGAMARIANYVKEESTIKKLTKATMDLAVAKEMDLSTAAELVAKTVGSSTNALARYGVQLKGNLSGQEKINELLKQLAVYQGQAEAQATTYSGRLEQMNNQIGDLKKEIGKGLLPTLTEFSSLLTEISGKISGGGLSGFIDKWLKLATWVPRKITLPIIDWIGGLFSSAQTENLNDLIMHTDSYINSINKLKNVSNEDPGSKDKFKFFSAIPQGYTAEQVAQFESLKFAAKGYVDYALAEIQRRYDVEVASANGSVERVKQAEENKKLAIAKLNQEIIEIQKSGADATEQVIQDSLDKRFQDLSDEIDKEAEAEAESYVKRQQAIDQYYQSAQTKGENYFIWRIGKIKQEVDELAQYDPVLAEQLKIDQLKSLEQEYLDWRLEAWKQSFGDARTVMEASFAGISAGYDTLWSTLSNTEMSGAERIQAIWDSIKSAALSTFGEILKGYIQSALQQAIVGETMKATQIAEGIAMGSSLAAAYAPAATMASIMSFGGASAIGLAALQGALAASTALAAVPKFAEGGIVPAGYPNDSFPALLTSGEVITPADRVDKQEKYLEMVNRKLDILNANLVNKNFAPLISTNIELDGRKIAKSVVMTMNKLQKEGSNFR